MSYEIKLDIFEGPLDLLLYLIKKNEIDIYNIPVALITDQYLKYIEMMRNLNLDLAGEYLVLASTLLYIKSRMLLPLEEEAESEEEDPRAELVRQLIEYQSYKDAAVRLATRPILERDVFTRGGPFPEDLADGDHGGDVELSVYDLIAAFQEVVSKMSREEILEIQTDRMSLTDCMNKLLERLMSEHTVVFTDLFDEGTDKKRMIYTFLALLELVKLQTIRVYQQGSFGVIRIFLAVEEGKEVS